MKITHIISKWKIARDNCKDCSFLLTNKRGGYLWLTDSPASRYQGAFFVENSKIYRVIENIGIRGIVDEMINRFWCVERIKETSLERFFMPYGHNCIVYETASNQGIELTLDIKESYINTSEGVYTVERESEKESKKDMLIIKYKTKEETFYVAVKISGNYKINGKFLERKYSYDENRKSPPFIRKVYNAAEINSPVIVVSFSKDKNSALAEAEFVFNNIEKLKKKQLSEILKIASEKIKDVEINMAYNCAKIMLYNLAIDDSGVYAGLPWFFQFWARDELISLKALGSITGMQKLKEKIFDRWLANAEKKEKMSANINMENREAGISVDAFGWLFKRAGEVKLSRERTRIMNEIADVSTELLTNEAHETWMDTIARQGTRIELQALKLNMLNSMYRVTGNKLYKIKEEILRKEVREKFWNGTILVDSLQEPIVRPNIFLTAYIYPELLNEMEWVLCSENALKRLWCECDYGGGISSADKTNPLFVDSYSGEDNKSYHNGDSWFWLNNLAAIVLWKIDRKKFYYFIKKILYASTTEILWMGAIGNHSEITSAKQLSSCGCISQAWSAAMFIEMVNELFSDNSFMI